MLETRTKDVITAEKGGGDPTEITAAGGERGVRNVLTEPSAAAAEEEIQGSSLLMKYTSCRRVWRWRKRRRCVWECAGTRERVARGDEMRQTWSDRPRQRGRLERRSLGEIRNECPFHLVSRFSTSHCAPSNITFPLSQWNITNRLFFLS